MAVLFIVVVFGTGFIANGAFGVEAFEVNAMRGGNGSTITPSQPPTIVDTLVSGAENSFSDIRNTAGGKVASDILTFISRKIGSPERINEAMKKAETILTRLNKHKADIQRGLSRLRSGTKNYNRTMKGMASKLQQISRQQSFLRSSVRKIRALKGIKLAGKGIALVGMKSDLDTLLSGKYKHNHSSMRFLRDTLVSASLAINSVLEMPVLGDRLKMTPLGKGAEGVALGIGLAKDYVTSDGFAEYMNSSDNEVLRISDEIIDNTNKYWTETFTEWIVAWDKYWGNAPSDEELARAEAILQQMRNKGLGRKPGDGIGAYKPNIYLYPEDEMDVSVAFDIPGLLETVIPAYHDRWLVTAQPDGTLIAEDGEAYTFLFYESVTWPWLYQTEAGWFVEDETRAEQMEAIMLSYGFTEQETADFVEYWTLKLDAGSDYAMYPQLTEIVDMAMPMVVEPAPDNLFRLWFAFEKNGVVDTLAIPEQIVRDGFAAVEWGGVILP